MKIEGELLSGHTEGVNLSGSKDFNRTDLWRDQVWRRRGKPGKGVSLRQKDRVYNDFSKMLKSLFAYTLEFQRSNKLV